MVRRLSELLDGPFAKNYEIIVVDDNSQIAPGKWRSPSRRNIRSSA